MTVITLREASLVHAERDFNWTLTRVAAVVSVGHYHEEGISHGPPLMHVPAKYSTKIKFTFCSGT